MKIEKDGVKIYTGVRWGKTLGSPIGLVVRNKDWENWRDKMSADPTFLNSVLIPLLVRDRATQTCPELLNTESRTFAISSAFERP